MLIGSLNGFEAVQDFCVIPRHDKPENLPVLCTDSESQCEVQQTVNVLRKGDEKSIVKQLLHLLQWCFPYNALILDGSVTYAHEEGSWRLSKCLGGMMEVSDSDSENRLYYVSKWCLSPLCHDENSSARGRVTQQPGLTSAMPLCLFILYGSCLQNYMLL